MSYNRPVPIKDYILKRHKRLLGNINLRIKDGQIIVSAPFWVSLKVIDDFVNSKESWITSVLQKQNKPEQKKYYHDGETHLIYGSHLPLSVKTNDSLVHTQVKLDSDHIKLTIFAGFDPEIYHKEAEKAFLSFYLQELSYYLTEKVNHYTNLLQVDYSKIEIKKVSSIWGSCSPSNVLSFNRKLIQAPKEIIDYVVIHEVCHLRERNHSSRFWALVSKFDKDYKNHRRWLHQNGVKLDI